MKAIQKIIKAYFKILSLIFPEFAGRQGFELFQRTRPFQSRFRKRELLFYKKARHFEVPGFPENSRAYEIGDPEGDLVILIHGWDSNAGSMARIGDSLAESGKRVVSMDLPGHGHSKLKKANIHSCREAVRNLVAYLEPKGPLTFVSHSFGSAVTAYAMWRSSYEIKKWVMLTTPESMTEIFKEFQSMIGLSERSYRVMEALGNRILNERISGLEVSKWMKEINVSDLVLIHDRFDRILPYSNSEKIKSENPRVKLKPLEKVGHYRMLTDAKVVQTVQELLWWPSKTNNRVLQETGERDLQPA